MSSLQYVAAVAAVVVALWPQLKQAGAWLVSRVPSLPESPARPVPTYAEAINQLAMVRLRLLETQALEDDQRKAIDILTLALVDGSDR